MHARFAILATMFLAACAAPPPPRSLPGPDVESMTLEWHGDTNRCTAVLVGPHTAITAGHCVVGQTHGIVASDRRPARAIDQAVVDPDLDLAFLSLTGDPERGPYARAASVARGAHVWLGGYGCTGQYQERELEYRGRDFDAESEFVGVACHGDSGAGLWTEDGELAGFALAIGIDPRVPRVYGVLVKPRS